MPSLSGRILNGAAWATAETWARQVALFAVFVVLARQLSPEALGLGALALVIPTILGVPVTQGVPEALIQRQELRRDHLDSAFWFLVLAGVAITVVIWGIAGLVAGVFGEPQLERLVRAGSFIVAIQSLGSVPTAILKRELKFKVLAVRTMLGTVVGGAIGIAMALSGSGVWSIVAMQVAKTAVETAVLFLGSAWRPRLSYNHASCCELLPFSGPITAHALWMYVNDELPKVILGIVLGPAAVGLYSFSRRPLEFLTQSFLSPLTNLAFPVIAHVQTEPAKIERFFDAGVRLSAIASFPVFVGFAAIAPEAIPAIFGEQWLSAVSAVQIFMLLGLMRSVESLCALTILALGRSGLLLKMHISYTVVALVLLPAAAAFGLEAMIGAVVLCNLLLLPPFLFLAGRIARIKILPPVLVLPRIAVAASVMFVAVTTWRHYAVQLNSLAVLVVGGIGVGVLSYATVAVVLMRHDLLSARDDFLTARS
jgi:O-antigen/teichoic acid export membrane protein